MSGVTELLSIEEAINLVGGKREDIHCFTNPNGMLVGADWSWNEFEDLLNNCVSRQKAGELAKEMKHPLAVFDGKKYYFFEELK